MNIAEYNYSLSKFFLQNRKQKYDAVEEVAKKYILPILVEFEEACLKPLFPTYSVRRIEREEICSMALVCAYIYTFWHKNQSNEEQFLFSKLANRTYNLNQISEGSSFFYILANYRDDLVVKQNIKMRDFLRFQVVSKHSDEFMSVCFGDFETPQYSATNGFSNLPRHLVAASPKTVVFSWSSQVANVETVVDDRIIKTRQRRPLIPSNRDDTFRLHIGSHIGVLGIDLSVEDFKFDAQKKQLSLPKYHAKMYTDGPDEIYESNSITDSFLFEMRTKEKVMKLVKRGYELNCSLVCLLKRKIVRDQVISYVLLAESKYAAILLWPISPIIFRQISIEESEIRWPIMAPFDQNGVYGVRSISLRCEDDDLTFYATINDCEKNDRIEVEKRGEKEVQTMDEEITFMNYRVAPIGSRQFLSKTSTFDILSNDASKCVLIRSNFEKNGPIKSISINNGPQFPAMIFKAEAKDTFIKRFRMARMYPFRISIW